MSAPSARSASRQSVSSTAWRSSRAFSERAARARAVWCSARALIRARMSSMPIAAAAWLASVYTSCTSSSANSRSTSEMQPITARTCPSNASGTNSALAAL